MRTIIAITAVIALSACAVPVTQTTGPNGEVAYSLKCSGYMRDRQDCLVKAAQLCPAGYRLIDESSRTNGAIFTGNALLIAQQDYMMVACK